MKPVMMKSVMTRVLAASALLLMATAAWANHIDVAAPSGVGVVAVTTDNQCSLREAMLVANGNTNSDCEIVSDSASPLTINLPTGAVFTLADGPYDADGPNGLPDVIGTYSIKGHDATIMRNTAVGTPRFRLLHVATAGTLALYEVTISHGYTSDGADGSTEAHGNGGYGANGGSIYNDGTLTLTNSIVSASTTGGGGDGGDSTGGNGGKGGDGGGIYNDGTLTLTSSTVSANATGAGGAGGNGDGGYGGDGGDGGDGGGIFNADSGTLILTYSTIEASVTGAGSVGGKGDGDLGGYGGNGGDGGGIANIGTLSLTDSKISTCATGAGGDSGNGDGTNDGHGGNGGNGGGIANFDTLTLTNSTVSSTATGAGGVGYGSGYDGGSGGNGGGIANYGTLTLTGSSVTTTSTGAGVDGDGNNGGDGGDGGGIFNQSTLTLTDSIVSHATTGAGSSNGGDGGDGGGIENSGPLFLTNTTINGNGTAAGGNGAGVDSYFATTLSISYSTISGNSGVGLRLFSNNDVTLDHSIIAKQLRGTDCVGTDSLMSSGYNLDSDGSCGFVATGDQSNTDPMLGPLADYGGPTLTMMPMIASPVIDAIPSANCTTNIPTGFDPSIDQRGYPRPGAGSNACDIGAVEVQVAASMRALGQNNQHGLTGDPFAYPLAVQLRDASGVGIPGITPSVSVPTSGAGAICTARASDATGIALTWCTANVSVGSYLVTLTVHGASGSLSTAFTLSNGFNDRIFGDGFDGSPLATALLVAGQSSADYAVRVPPSLLAHRITPILVVHDANGHRVSMIEARRTPEGTRVRVIDYDARGYPSHFGAWCLPVSPHLQLHVERHAGAVQTNLRPLG